LLKEDINLFTAEAGGGVIKDRVWEIGPGKMVNIRISMKTMILLVQTLK
jgi:hypothetical protein